MGMSEDQNLLSVYHEYLRKINLQQIRLACILGFTLVPLFGFLDYFIVQRRLGTFFLIRLACTLLILFFYFFSFTSLGKKNINLLGELTAMLIGGMVSWMTRYHGGYESPYYAGLNLVMLATSILATWDLKITAGICLAIYGSYVIPILLYDQIKRPEILISNNLFLLSTMIVALAGSYLISRLRFSEFQYRYQLEESRRALQDSNEELKKLGEMKNRFFADISHELKTPLAVIRGEAEVTLRGKEKPVSEYQQALQYIVLLVDQLNKLVSDLLFLARSESGTVRIEKQEVALREVIEEALREGEILALKKGVALSLKGLPEEEIVLLGDPQRLKQLFMILIDNAINYSRAGGRVEVAWEREGGCGKITISDQGVGIPEESLPRLFDRFYRVEKTKSMAMGTGLGLPIAKWIAEAHDGRIAITSRLDVGTTVTVSLPVCERVKV